MYGWPLDVRGERAAPAIAKAKEVLLTVGLSHKENAFPHELSGGEQQRVAIARAIVGDAAVILADEPTGALDGENGYAIMTILSDIAKDPVARRVGGARMTRASCRSPIGSFTSRTAASSKEGPADQSYSPAMAIPGK